MTDLTLRLNLKWKSTQKISHVWRPSKWEFFWGSPFKKCFWTNVLIQAWFSSKLKQDCSTIWIINNVGDPWLPNYFQICSINVPGYMMSFTMLWVCCTSHHSYLIYTHHVGDSPTTVRNELGDRWITLASLNWSSHEFITCFGGESLILIFSVTKCTCSSAHLYRQIW
jgi:hypothetical protein